MGTACGAECVVIEHEKGCWTWTRAFKLLNGCWILRDHSCFITFTSFNKLLNHFLSSNGNMSYLYVTSAMLIIEETALNKSVYFLLYKGCLQVFHPGMSAAQCCSIITQ